MSDNGNNPVLDFIKHGLNSLGELLQSNNKDLITVLRTPTPYKIVRTFVADGNGAIGGGLPTGTISANPIEIYMCPENHEAWLHRIAITASNATPRVPLTTGELVGTGSSAGELIFFLPLGGVVAPVIMTEGRGSAAHLNGGERLLLAGDFLPAYTIMRIDLQLFLTSGISTDTPKPVPATRIYD